MSAATLRSLSTAVHSAIAAFVRELAPFDSSGHWREDGISSCEHWLTLHAGFDFPTARRLVELARALPRLPEVQSAFSAGHLSLDQVRAVAAVATPQDQSAWLDVAGRSSTPQLQRITQAYAQRQSATTPDIDAQRRAKRRLVTFWQDDGMLRLIAELPPEDGAVVLAALESHTHSTPASTREQQRADALVAACTSPSSSADAPHPVPTVLIHVDAKVLEEKTDSGRSHVNGGPSISPALARHLSCDANVARVIEKDGLPINMGRTARVVASPLRRALHVRDRGCSFPGCTVPARHTHAHHIRHWAHGGLTDIDNLTLLCAFHHQRLHDGDISIERTDSGLRWLDSHSRPIGPQPREPSGASP